MINEIIFIVEDSLKGGFEAKAVGYSIYTQADTYEEIKTNIREAVSCYFNDGEISNLIKTNFAKQNNRVS